MHSLLMGPSSSLVYVRLSDSQRVAEADSRGTGGGEGCSREGERKGPRWASTSRVKSLPSFGGRRYHKNTAPAAEGAANCSLQLTGQARA
jgi:hypothetical protein